MAKRTSVRKADLLEWARGFSLLSDPTRLGILSLLAKGPKNVTALCKALGLKQPPPRATPHGPAGEQHTPRQVCALHDGQGEPEGAGVGVGEVDAEVRGYVGGYTGSIGTVTLTGEDSTWQSFGNLYLGGDDTGDGGDASLDISGGGRVYVGDIDPATVTLGSAYSGLVVSDDDKDGGKLLLRKGATLINDYEAYLGYNAGETGAAFASAITGLIRQKHLEYDGSLIQRA